MNNVFWFVSLVFMDSIDLLISMLKVVIFYHAIIILNGCICRYNSSQTPNDRRSNYRKFQKCRYCLEIIRLIKNLTISTLML